MIKTLPRILIAIIVGCISLWPAILPENWRVFAQSGIDPGKPKTTPKPAPKPAVKPKPKSDDSKSGHALTVDLGSGVSMEFVRIPAGSFQMGSTNGVDSEKPVHQVTINRSFYMGKFEVTQAQWQAVMGINPSTFKNCGGNCPVEQVSWDDTQQFINRLNSRDHRNAYRLPSEAEWEYAARAGTVGDYAGKLEEMAWYDSNSNHTTHPAGKKRPNAWGLYDMHGNVWEWVEDWYNDSYGGAPTDGSAWERGELKYRVLRGGSWSDPGLGSRSADRDYYPLHNRYGNVGLRVVLSPR